MLATKPRLLRAVALALLAAAVAHASLGPALQMQLGNPSNATADATNRTRYLIQRAQYALDYSDTTREPNWVAWHLSAADLGTSGRSDDFAADTSLPAGFYRVLPTDYSGSGFDRGHLCPSADRTLTTADNQATFLMSNMVPQTPDNNQGAWASFETYCRTLATAGNELLIVTGPGGFSPSATLASGVAIPGYTWKLVVVLPVGAGPATDRISATTRVIAIKIPNVAGIRSNPWQQYLVSPATLETDTGYTFFTALPAAVATALRAKIDDATSTGSPRITTQPAAQTASLGGGASFTVAATGNTPLNYQWSFDGNEIAGATAATLTLASVQAAQLGAYSVVITNSLGSVTSATAALNLGSGAGSVYWDFALATPAGGLPADLTGGTVTQGNNNGTTALITAVSVASGYTGVSGGNNAGAAARTGALNRTPATGSAYFEFTMGAVAGRQLVFSSLSFGARSTGTGPQAFAIFTSLDDFAAPLAAGPLANDSAWRLIAPTFAAFSAAPGTSVTFRIYGYNGTGNAGVSTANWRIDDLRLGVNVVANTATPPVITRQPGNITVVAGRTATLTTAATGTPAPTFQWRKDGVAIPGATEATLTLTNVTPAQSGAYTVVVANPATTVTSGVAYLTVLRRSYAGYYFGAVVAPSATASPNGGEFALLIRADHSAVLLGHERIPELRGDSRFPEHTRTYVARSGFVDDTGILAFEATSYTPSPFLPASAPALIVSRVSVRGTINDSGALTGRINESSSITASKSSDTGSTAAFASLYTALSARDSDEVITMASPAGQFFAVKQTAGGIDAGGGVLASDGNGSISTNGFLGLRFGFSAANRSLTVTGSVAVVTVDIFTGFAEDAHALSAQRLANLSTRASAGTGDQAAIVGFVIAGLESKTVLIRAIGPALRNFGVATVLAAPRLDLMRGATSLAANTGWATAANATDIAAAATRAGAFALAAGSADSAILTTLAPGNYTAVVSAADATAGPALVEVYDVSGGSLLQKLSNLSTRAVAGTGDNTLIAGVVVSGSVPKRVLIRAAGPSLAQFGLGGVLARPQLTLFSGTTTLATNSGWSTSPDSIAIAEASSRVGAFAFPASSADAALIINLAPGAYTAQVTGLPATAGVNNTSGLALVEIYEVP